MAPSLASGGLVLPFVELIRECGLLESYAKPFLDKMTIGILAEAKGNLEAIQKKGPLDEPSKWSIPLERPLRTVVSQKESKPDARCKHFVTGVFSFIWEIRPLDEPPWKGRKHLLLDGKASTRIRFIEAGDDGDVCLAQWTVDVGDQQAPGTHFHYQFNGFEKPPFPTSLDVPRLPAMAMSPFMAIEMAIAELFQDRWKKHAVQHTPEASAWRNIQSPRLTRYFEWQIARLAKTHTGSPWAALKLDKPDRDLLVKDR